LEDKVKMTLKEKGCKGHGVDSSGLKHRPAVVYREHGIGTSVSIKRGEFLE
jgi:hypothetical protein